MTDVSRRRLLSYGAFAGAALATAPLLAACSSGAAKTRKNGKTSGAVSIQMWTHDKGYQRYFTEEAKSLTSAKKTPFRYTLDTTIIAAPDLITKLLAAASAGRTMPDMVGIEIGQFPRLMSGGIAGQVLESLDDRIAKVKDDIIESRLAPFSVDGHAYGLDSDTPVVVYYYRPDLFKKYSIPEVETWEEYSEFGSSFHSKTGISLLPIATGPGNVDVVGSYASFLFQRGGALFTQKGELALDSNEAVETIEFLAKGLQSGFIIGLDNLYGGPVQAGFKSGSIIGAAMPDWYNTYGIQVTVPEQKGQWAIRPTPKFAKGGFPTSTQGGTGFAATKGKDNATAVLDLLSNTYLTTAGQVERFKTIGYLPTLKSAYASPELKNFEDPFLGGQKTFEVYSKLALNAPPIYQSPHGAVLTDALGGPLLDAFKGKIDANTAIKQAIATYKQQVS